MERLIIKGVIGKADDAVVEGEKDYFDLEKLENWLDSRKETGEFEALINSPGGGVEEGFKIYDRLLQENVTTIAERANSIASVIFQAGKKRLVPENAEILIHNAWAEPEALTGEVLNVHTLKEITAYFEETDARIVNVYASNAGEDKTAELLALMSQDTDIGADKAIDLGLATGKYEGALTGSKNLKARIITYSNNLTKIIDKNEDMKTEERLSAFEKALKALTGGFKKLNAKNFAVSTAEGEMFVAGEGELVGREVFRAEDGVPTEIHAPAGKHTLEDGTVITIGEDGKITEAVSAASVEETVAMLEEEKAKTKAMEEEKSKLEIEVKDLKNKLLAKEKDIKSLETQFIELKNEVIGDPDKKKKEPEILSKEDFAKLSAGEKIRRNAMNRANSK